MFKNLFSCFKKQQNVDIRDSYQRRESSMLQQEDCEDIYGRGSIAIRQSRDVSETYKPKETNEEIRIIAFGPIADHFKESTLPEELKESSRKVARIGIGENHAVFLFQGSEIGIVGKNDKGQLGMPISDKDSENIYKDLSLVEFDLFKNEGKIIIDIAAGSNHTMILVEPHQPDPDIEGDQRQVYIIGDRNMHGKFSSNDSHEPVLVEIPRIKEDPELKIKFIYSSNEKWIVVDSGNGMTIWGKDFDGFILREPTLFCVFKYEIK